MKHFTHVVLLLAVLLLAVPLQGEPVGSQRALETAQAFFRHDRNQSLRLAPLERLQLASAPLTKAGEAEPAFFVYNRRGGGFVIIAGDDACVPVLGYSFTGSFRVGNDMPDGLRAWLDDLEEQVTIVRNHHSQASRAEARPAWDALMVETKAGGGLYRPAVKLETPLWGQGEPFNNLAPFVDGKKTVAGCVPLAMSMICRFFGYPAAGKGTLPDYTYETDAGNNQTILGFELGQPYDWAHIKMSYKDGYTEEEAAAVAQLVYECGVMVQAKYAASTSANTTRMAGCAVSFLGFDPGACYYKREFFTDEEWLEMLKAELQEHPVLYSARRETGGHSFLIDGYDEQGNVSVNWGWSGGSNGYYALSAFTPSESRAYIYSHGAVFGLKPDASSGEWVEPKEYLYFQAGTSSSSGTVYNGLIPSGTIVPGQSFKMGVGFLYNGGIHPFTGQYCIVLKDKDGNVKEYVSAINSFNELSSGSGRGYPSVECLMQSYPLEGDRLSLLYRSNNWPEGVWESPLYDKTSDIVAEIAVSDDTTLAQVTGIEYNKTNGEVTIQTKDLTDVALRNASGTLVTDCVISDMTHFKINSSELQSGTYTLTLSRFGDKVTLTLKMGKK